jgi:hypothetical protein
LHACSERLPESGNLLLDLLGERRDHWRGRAYCGPALVQRRLRAARQALRVPGHLATIHEVLERFRAGGSGLILLWWAFMLSGLLLIAGAVLLGQSLGFGGIVPLATAIGVLAGLVQMLGLLRWVYVVPGLARSYADPTLGPEQREVHATVFRALRQYLGVGVGEHLGYLFHWYLVGPNRHRHCSRNGTTDLAGLARDRHRRRGDSRFGGVPRTQRREGLATCRGSDPVLYIAWSLWLLTLGVALIV